MKTLFFYLKDYIQEHFSWKLYLATALFASLLIFFNFRYSIEDNVMQSGYGGSLRLLLFFLFQGIPYYIVCVFVLIFTKNKSFFKQKEFWIISVIGFFILAFHRSGSFTVMLSSSLSTSPLTYHYTYKLINKFMPLLTVVLPLAVFYWFYLRKQFTHFYGIRKKGVYVKPYFILLALMLPLIIIASFQPDFLRQYPNYMTTQGWNFAHYTGTNENFLIGIYEAAYAFGFFIVELFFRGFLIYGMVKYLGKDVVLPMAVTYCVFHFGKPMGEAISSIFGGYILGILAYKTENIYGGIIVHIGIALLMDLFAFLQM